MYTIDDIQIFITTHNRANYLKESIESILNQSANVKEIIVLDNESTDNTEEVVKTFSNKGVKYIKTFDFLGNFKKARELVKKPYCMLFHDDDILHPEYLKLALKILNNCNNISLITTKYTEFYNDNKPQKFEKLNSHYYLFKAQKDFATYMFFIEHIAYAPAIYRTKDFLSIDLEYEKYGKFNDWPFMVKMAGLGNSVLFDDTNLFFVRKHNGQDTTTNTNTINFEQIINWDKIFYDIFKKSQDKKLIGMYKYKSEYFLKSKYDSFISQELKESFSYKKLLELANKSGLKDICLEKSIVTNPVPKEYWKYINNLKKCNLHKTFLNTYLHFIYQIKKLYILFVL